MPCGLGTFEYKFLECLGLGADPFAHGEVVKVKVKVEEELKFLIWVLVNPIYHSKTLPILEVVLFFFGFSLPILLQPLQLFHSLEIFWLDRLLDL